VRISRPRLLLRIALLLVAAAFMGWKAWEAWRGSAAPGLDPGAALLLHRVALIEALLAVLAIATALAAGLALRTRPHRKLLRLDEAPPGPPPAPPADQ
jgi:hypothetical protein